MTVAIDAMSVTIVQPPNINEVVDGTQSLVLTRHDEPTTIISGLEALLKELGLNIPIPRFTTANVLSTLLDIGRCYLADLLSNIVPCDRSTAYSSIHLPTDIDNGDLAVILPKLSPGADVDALGRRVVQDFPSCPLFTVPFVDGVHLRIIFAQDVFSCLVSRYINDRKSAYGQYLSLGLREPSSPDLGRKKALIEFSSPNLASEFHAKHLRSTILGACIANLYESMGWDVTRINYLGDWGKPIALLGVGWEKFGSEDEFKADPVEHLLHVHTQINELFLPEQLASKEARDEAIKHHKEQDTSEIESQGLFAERNAFFKRMEEGDYNAIAFWKRVREVNVANFARLYARLGVHFDEYSGESQVSSESMAEVEELLKTKGLLEESGGSWIIDLRKHKSKAGTVIIRDRAGSSTYFLRDIATVFDRNKRYSFDKMLYVVASDHATHFSRLSKVLELMDRSDLANKLQHVSFSEVPKKLDDASPWHTLDEILDQCQIAVRESIHNNQEKAHALCTTGASKASIATAALVTQELSAKRSNDNALDISQMTSFDTGTGPNIQFWYTRLCSILKNNSIAADFPKEESASLKDVDHLNLLRLIAEYPDVTLAAYKFLEPVTIMGYVNRVVEKLSCCLVEIGDVDKMGPAQTMLFESTRTVLENGMKLLGIRMSTS